MAKLDPDAVRNVALVGHGTVGKTTLLDNLLYFAKAVDRKGSVDDGTSLLDYDDEEKARHYSIDSHIAHLDWKGKRFNFIDCPGYPDFMSQAISAIHNVETVAVVIDSHRGIEVNTRRMFEEAGRAGVARMIILAKLDGENIDFESLVERIQATFGKECVLIQAPVGVGHDFRGLVDVLHAHAGDPAPEGVPVDPKVLYDSLVERVVETDDELLEKFLEGEIPTPERLFEALTTAVTAGRIVPIVCAAGKKEIGLAELLDDLSDFAPSPARGLVRHARRNGDCVTVSVDSQAPVIARCFKTHVDKFGNLTYFRVLQGVVRSNSAVKNSRDGQTHRLGQLHRPQGKSLEKVDEVGPGDFVCVAKLEHVEINDTMSEDGLFGLDPISFPKPMFPLAVSAKSRGDDAKILSSLRKMVHEDPCLAIHRDEQTLETIMQGLSQLHLEVVQHRLKVRDGVELVTHEPKVPYKETITKTGESMYRHKKQTGGRGQFAEVHLRLHPRERGSGFEFINSIVGGVIPGQYIPAVEKGIRETMAHGILSGSEVVDVAAEVFFGKYHDVDSSEAAFKHAASMAFKEAFAVCGPVLLEPIVTIEVTVPAEKMGDINGDLNSRRAHITGMEVMAGGLQVVRAEVPIAEVLRYQTELKSMTGGQGSFSMEFSRLAPAPPNVQQQVVEKHKKHKLEKVEH